MKCKPLHPIKGKNKERYDIIDRENYKGVTICKLDYFKIS